MFLALCARHALIIVTALTAAVAGSLAGQGARRAAPAWVSPQAPAAQHVLLVNGDRLTITPGPDGRSAISDLPAAAGHDSLLSLRVGQTVEEIPVDALPDLGHGLDPSLFNVADLEHAEADGRLWVRVTFTGRQPRLPGVILTRSGAQSADGYLTASSASAFGAALERLYRADHARGSYGSGLFASGTDITLAREPAPVSAVRPGYPSHTLTVTASDLSGKPDSGDTVWVFDADNLAAFDSGTENTATFCHGVARFSVPTGHYWAIAEFGSLAAGNPAIRLDVLPEFTVGHDTTVHTAEAAADSEITMATPRPAVRQDVTFTVVLGDRLGSAVSMEWFNEIGPIWVSPTTRKPAVGTLHAYTSAQLTSPPDTVGPPYAYNLEFAGPPGLIPAQHYQARRPSLATVTERYYQDVRSTGDWTTFGAFPGQGLMAFSLEPLPLPGIQVQYFSTAPALLWSSSYDAFLAADGFASGGQNDDTFTVLHPGEHQVVDWNRYPLHPQPDVSTGGAGGRLIPLIPSAIRSGNTLTLTTTPFSDNQPGHLSAGSATGTTVTVSYEIDQNGVKIAGGNAADGIPPVALSTQPSGIRFTLDAARAGTSYRQSTASHTVWTWRSRQQPAATVPLSWYCSYSASGQPLRRCAVQPMMTLDYQVHGLALNGTARPGPQLISMHAGHIQLATAARITGATAQVSCNDGKSWQRAVVTSAGSGNFRVAFSAPADCYVTLHVSAADAAGDSIAETVYRAYRLVP